MRELFLLHSFISTHYYRMHDPSNRLAFLHIAAMKPMLIPDLLTINLGFFQPILQNAKGAG
jgi:hypothetical protein